MKNCSGLVGLLKNWKWASTVKKYFFYVTNPEVLFHDTGDFRLHGLWSKSLWGTMCGIAGTAVDQNWNTLVGLWEVCTWTLGKYERSGTRYLGTAEGLSVYIQLEFYLLHFKFYHVTCQKQEYLLRPSLLNVTNCTVDIWHPFCL